MAIPAQIGRFKIDKELGKGSQGVVYLATDTRLERQVAIKTLHLHLSENGDKKIRLMREAKLVSKLQHPNIIPVYDAGEYDGKPYLVFEFVEGISLRDYIKKEGVLVIHSAITMITQLLEGIANAHKQGIVHRDMSPSNIMISKNGVPRIMDFGISIMMGNQRTIDSELSGTPCYMSPEHFSKSPVGPQSDIFALGLIFYEMLVGHPAIRAENHFAVMYKIANDPIDPPSLKNDTIDKGLDAIILKALEKKLSARYGDALEMKEALNEYLEVNKSRDEVKSDDKSDHSTLEFLLRKIRHKSDFPSFSKNIMDINKKASVSRANYSSASELANTILKDYSLTSKLLKLVNSAFYGQFSGKITTISRAVVILGFEQVSMVASGLMLFEHLKNKSQSIGLQDAALSSFMSGIIAQDLAGKIGFKETEEAFICSMLRNLGKHLVLFYFPEEHTQIMNLMAQKGVDERTAVRSILGINYEELGMGVAKTWKFPLRIVRSMKALPKGKMGKLSSEEDTLRNISGFSNELCSIAGAKDEENGKALKNLLSRFEDTFPVSKKQISKLLDNANGKIEEYSDTLKINLQKSRFMKQVESYTKAQEPEKKDAPVVPIQPKPAEKSDSFDPNNTQAIEITDVLPDVEETKDSESILINGIQEITNALLEDYELNDVLNVILETIYRGFGLNRVLFCIRDNQRHQMKAVYGFGKDIEKIIGDFAFKIGKPRDVFCLALAQGKDLGINNAYDLGIKKGIPEWYEKAINAPAFVLYPIMLNKIALGLIYADRDEQGAVLKGNHLNYMKTLCNQAVLAMKQIKYKG